MTERRPLTTREHPLSIYGASCLARTGISPNAISVIGMLAAGGAGIALALTEQTNYGWVGFLVAVVGIQIRLLANMFDGMVALQTKQTSPVGELFNEVPDRISDTAILIGAGYATGGCPELGYLAAIAALFTAYIRAEGKVAGAPQDYCGPMAKPQRMAVITAVALYAGLVPATFQPWLAALPDLSIVAAGLAIVAIGSTLTFVRRLIRIAQVLQRNKA